MCHVYPSFCVFFLSLSLPFLPLVTLFSLAHTSLFSAWTLQRVGQDEGAIIEGTVPPKEASAPTLDVCSSSLISITFQ
ncbi:hypothetical protein K457DRAFT_135931 [Linnemannia elongata AG-77]|uniref:Uncharacterized protein n=1 Tax=Linnemannia elongata AG-77 TaxID=1314771 RepID=A0A197K3L4_9FUNG|nr:hypothetical protein K457DRAFT_135931 [Linnemannia elongata AG-77]